MQTTTIKSQVMNEVLAAASIKGNFSAIAAQAAIVRASLHAIVDGNSRPFIDTVAAIPKPTVKDKDGASKYADSLQGFAACALVAACESSRNHYQELHANGLNSRGEVKLDKKLSSDDIKSAAVFSENIGKAFADHISSMTDQLKEKRKAASDKTQATKAASAKLAVAEVAKAEAKAAEVAAEVAANTLTISDFLKAIAGGEKSALKTALVIAEALQAYNAAALNAAANAAHKAAEKSKAAEVNKATMQANKAANALDLAAAKSTAKPRVSLADVVALAA